MDEAEHIREAKRVERARKQKIKIDNYHNSVKEETSQIQELLALGIDPSSIL
jgi:hypothetical protein